MDKSSRLICLLILLAFGACTKDEQVTILQDKYPPKVQDAQPDADEFTVSLNASVLQSGERGEWKIVEGPIVDEFVYLEDKNNPFSRFKGLPAEEYTLGWTHWDASGKMTVVKTKVKIAPLNIEITDSTPQAFQTIRTFSVDPKYKGKWSFDQSYGYLTTKYFDGSSEPPENKPSVELHGNANTTYTATYTHTYAGREHKFQKVVKTGDYTEDEALYELQLQRGTYSVIEDPLGHILEVKNIGAVAWKMMHEQRYPALRALKYLRRLNIGGSLEQIPNLFGDYYTDLEELRMDPMGGDLVFPDNFGNLTKLKILYATPKNSVDPNHVIKLPASFGKLKALETFSVNYFGNINFNGTLGQLTSLQYLHTQLTEIPENIGNLKNLQHLDVSGKSAVFPQRLAECTSLAFARFSFAASATGTLFLPSRIGELKKLHTLELSVNGQLDLPPSFSELAALKVLKINGVRSVPETFGNLSSLQDLSLYGTFTKLPNSFGKLSSLEYLYLGGKAESLPESFGDLSSLLYLSAEHSPLKTFPGTFGKLKKLNEIAMRSSKIEYLPESFGELDGLRKLDLSTSQLKTFPKQIIPLKGISQVILTGCQVGDLPVEIAKMRSGAIFYLYGVPNLTYDHMTYINSLTTGIMFYTSFGYF